MKKMTGIILFTAGIVGSLIFGLDAYQNTESVKILGSKFTLSQADWTPFIISLILTIIGIVFIAASKPPKRSGKRK